MAARRPYWKGFLKLSLVTCPIALHSASSQAEKTHFHQINRKTGNRLRQHMVDEETGQRVEKEDKARGYEISEGHYVEIKSEELDVIEVESTHTLSIESFVPQSEIDKRYYERPYYVVPDGKGGEDAFVVIRDAMKNKDRVALARIVFANREHIVALEAWGKGMLCTTLRYDYEVKPADELFEDITDPRVSKEMVELASHILDSKAGHFDPASFKDQYELALRELLKSKTAGKTIARSEPRKGKSNVVDLMSALRESLKGSTLKARSSPVKRTARKKVAAR